MENFDISKVVSLLFGKLEGWLEAAVKMLPNFIIAIIFVFLFHFLARGVEKLVKNGISKVSKNSAANDLISTISRVSIMLLGIFVALGVLQLDKALTSLLAGAGVIGLILGFAFQEIASNFIAGIIIAFWQPFKVDDIIEIDSYVGRIKNIDLRTTLITTLQGSDVIMPNKDMFTKPLVNFTSTPNRRIDVSVGVSYGEDLENVQKITLAALEGIDGHKSDRPLEFFFTEFADSSINFVVRIWVDNPQHKFARKTTHEAILRIKKTFDENGIVIPFPIRTLDFGIKGGERLSTVLASKGS